jgi:hypothetical protein
LLCSLPSGLKLTLDQAINAAFSLGDMDAGAVVDFAYSYSLRQDALDLSLAALAGIRILSPSRAVSGVAAPFVVQTSGAVTRVDFSVVRDGVELPLGSSSTPLYRLRSGAAIFSVLFDSTAVARVGVKYCTFKAVATLPSGSFVDARAAQVVNHASGSVTFSFVVSNSGGGAAVTVPGRLLQSRPVTPDGDYGFMNSLTNFVEVTKSGSTASITRVDFYRTVAGQASRFLSSATASPFRTSFSVSDLDINTVVTIEATITASDGTLVYATFAGRVREPNLAPTDIRISAATVAVRYAGALTCRLALLCPLTAVPTSSLGYFSLPPPTLAFRWHHCTLADLWLLPVVLIPILTLTAMLLSCLLLLQENLAPGAAVGVVSAVDPNSLDVFTYQIITPAPPAAYPPFTLVGNQVCSVLAAGRALGTGSRACFPRVCLRLPPALRPHSPLPPSASLSESVFVFMCGRAVAVDACLCVHPSTPTPADDQRLHQL